MIKASWICSSPPSYFLISHLFVIIFIQNLYHVSNRVKVMKLPKKEKKNDGLLLLLGEGFETGSKQEQFRKGLAESGGKHTHPLTQKFQLLGVGSVELCYGQISSQIMLAEHGLLLEEIGPAERNLGWQHNFAKLRINRTMKGEFAKRNTGPQMDFGEMAALNDRRGSSLQGSRGRTHPRGWHGHPGVIHTKP